MVGWSPPMTTVLPSDSTVVRTVAGDVGKFAPV
jgi:hypothetical protein